MICQTAAHSIVYGTRCVTADTDLRLTHFFDLSQGFFLRIQNRYDMMRAKRGCLFGPRFGAPHSFVG
jgi:addiction module HigA family antidote